MRRKASLLCFSSVLLAAPAFAASQELRDPRYLSSVRSGFDLLYSLDYEEAESVFRELKREFPGHPGPPLDLAVVLWQKELFRRRDLDLDHFVSPAYFARARDREMPDEARQEFFRNIEQSIESAERILASRPDDLDTRYYLGAAHGVLASFAITIDGDRRQAFEHGKRAYGEHHAILERDPEYYDAYMSVGLYEYVVDNLPWYIKWLAVIVGYRGSEERGFEYLQMTVDRGEFASDDARVIQMVLFVREERYQEALANARHLHESYPRNFLLHLNRAQILEKMEEDEAAARVYEEILELAEAGRPNYQRADLPELRSEIAERLFALGELDPARRELEKIVADGGEMDSRHRALAHLRLGQIHDLGGERDKALEHYRVVLRFDEHEDLQEVAEDYLEKPYMRKS